MDEDEVEISLSLSELAGITGVSEGALRNWRNNHLLSLVELGSKKLGFSLDAIGRVRFIKECRDDGYNFKEIGNFFSGGLYERVEEKELERELLEYRLKQMRESKR